MAFYPINLNITAKRCLVIGGGKVAARKLRSLVECGAEIVVISPEICQEVTELVLTGKVYHQKRGYEKGDLRGAFLCIAATDNRDIQEQVKEEARQERILLNSIDDQQACDFQVPSKIRRGDLLLTISTGGGSPALSKTLRQKLEVEFGEEYGLLVRLLSLIRLQMLALNEEGEKLKPIFQKLVDLNYLPLLVEEDWTELERSLLLHLPENVNVKAIIKALKDEMEV